MAEPISIQQLKDASEDAITLADFIYKPANVMIPRRLAADINSLQYYLDYMSSYAQHSYETYDEMLANAVNLPNGVSAFVTNDLDTTKNGIYTYNGVSFVKGDYQPEKAAKDYVEAKIDALPFEDGVLSDTFVVVDGTLSQRTINKGLESIADLSTINNPKDGLRVYVKSYHAGLGKGGGEFVYNSSMAKSEHNGGTIIDPTKVFPDIWSDFNTAKAWFAANTTGTGCWVRLESEEIYAEVFGMIGDGVTDNTAAIQQISAHLNKNTTSKLSFSRDSVYRMGRQVQLNPKVSGITPETMLELTAVHGLTIEGNGASLKLNDGLKYGSFDPVTGEVYTPTTYPLFTNWNYGAILGFLSRFVNCTGLKIKDLVLDGNMENVTVGGWWGEAGIQLRAVGIEISGGSNINLTRVHGINNCLDGMTLRSASYNAYDVQGRDNVVIEQCIFDKNGRQGVSVTGGSGISFIDTQFTSTGRGKVRSNPAAGCDIEPDGVQKATHISFTRCLFAYNTSTQVVCDMGAKNSRYITFDNCDFWGAGGQPIWFLAPDTIFNDCRIHGESSNILGLEFNNCSFDDKTHAVYGSTARSYLITTGGAVFNDCTFDSFNGSKLIYNTNPKTVMRDCILTVHDAGDKNRPNGDFMGIFTSGITLINAVFMDTFPVDSALRYYYSRNDTTKIVGSLYVQNNAVRFGNENYRAEEPNKGYLPVNANNFFKELKLYTEEQTFNATLAYRSAPPTTATRVYTRGSIIFNNRPAIGSPVGWVFVGGDYPAAWQPFGFIGAPVTQTTP